MKEYKLKIWETAALCALCVTLGVCAWAQGRQQDISSSLVRLHVIAASDEAAEQELKMRVRDSVLEYLTPVLDSAESPAQARSIINAEIPNIRAAAEKCAEGRTVRVTLGSEYYPTREYDSFSLPAGQYSSLRVIIGQGQGHNWWCVMFPDLCVTKDDKVRINNTARKKMEKLLGKKTIRKITKDKYLGWLFKV